MRNLGQEWAKFTPEDRLPYDLLAKEGKPVLLYTTQSGELLSASKYSYFQQFKTSKFSISTTSDYVTLFQWYLGFEFIMV